jgi:hypothetical protein
MMVDKKVAGEFQQVKEKKSSNSTNNRSFLACAAAQASSTALHCAIVICVFS